MAKKRKAYNPMKQMERVAHHLIRDKVVCYLDGIAGCVVVDVGRSRIVPPETREGKQVIAALARPHKWSCYIAVFGRNQQYGGVDEYMKSEQLFVESKYYQEDLAPMFEKQHKQLIASMNPDHLCGVGWIADPLGAEYTEDQAANIFKQLGAWND